jgi:hypothetical protein
MKDTDSRYHVPIFFLLAQKENGQKEKGHGNRNARGEQPPHKPKISARESAPFDRNIGIGRNLNARIEPSALTAIDFRARGIVTAENFHSQALPKSSAVCGWNTALRV